MDKELKEKVFYHSKGLAVNLPKFIVEFVKDVFWRIYPILWNVWDVIWSGIKRAVSAGIQKGAPTLYELFRR